MVIPPWYYHHFYHSIHCIQEKYVIKTSDKEILLPHNFVQYSLELLNGICSLLLGGNNNSVISVYRTFYDNYIVFAYIQKHPELIDAFLDHVSMDECLLKIDQAHLEKKDVSKEISDKYNSLIAKYGDDFQENYGWASSVINDKNLRNLKFMYESSDLGEEFSFYYKLSCSFWH